MATRTLRVHFNLSHSDTLIIPDVTSIDLYESQEMSGYRCPKAMFITTASGRSYSLMLDKVLYYSSKENK